MTRSILGIVISAASVAFLAGAAFSQPKDKKDAKAGEMQEIEVFQLLSCEEKETLYEAAGGGGMTVKLHNYQIQAKPLFGGDVQKVVLVQAKDGALAKLVTGMKPGDFLTMTTQKQYNHVYVRAIAAYPLRPGEERQGVYVFVETSSQKTPGGADATAVKLYKLGKFATAMIPNVPDKASGKTVPDPNLSQAVGKLKQGESVEIVFAGGGPTPPIKSIEPFAAPQNGVVVQLTQADVEGGKTPAIEVTIGGSDVTVLVPGKRDAKGAWLPDGALSSAIRGFKKDDKVTVRYRVGDDGKNWLKEIARSTEPPAGK